MYEAHEQQATTHVQALPLTYTRTRILHALNPKLLVKGFWERLGCCNGDKRRCEFSRRYLSGFGLRSSA